MTDKEHSLRRQREKVFTGKTYEVCIRKEPRKSKQNENKSAILVAEQGKQ
jgi:hypothetical protein